MAITTTFTLKFAGAAVERGLARVQSAFKSLGGVALKVGKSLLSPFAALTALLGTGALVSGLMSFVKGSSAAASSVESLTTQFTTLLGSATAAKARMEEITKFAASTPFEIAELAATSKLLEVMGGKLISTGDGLRLVGDAAAMAGQPIEEVGLHIGRLFSAITSGTSAGESVNRLQELGLITGATKIKFEELAEAQKKGIAASGGSSEQIIKSKKTLQELSSALEISLQRQKEFTKQTSTSSRMAMTSKIEDLKLRIKEAQSNLSSMLNPNQSKGKNMILSQVQALKLLQGVMSKAQGGMAALSNTTEGKLSNMKDNLTQLKVAFGTGFNDGLRIALDAVNTKLPQLLAKFTEFGKLIGNTISDAVDGDFVRFFMIGSMIGEVIMEGINLTTKSQFLKLGQFVRREVFGGLAGEIEKYTKPEKMVQREEKDRKDRQFMQEYELGVFVSNMKERYAEAIKLPTAPERQKSVYLGPMGNENFPDDWKSNNKIMLDIKTGIDGLNQKLSPQP
jgi:hypothetical protein